MLFFSYIDTQSFALWVAILAMKVTVRREAKFSTDSRERETARACIESSDNDSALLEAFDDAKCGGRRGWAGCEERKAGRETRQVVVLSR